MPTEAYPARSVIKLMRTNSQVSTAPDCSLATVKT